MSARIDLEWVLRLHPFPATFRVGPWSKLGHFRTANPAFEASSLYELTPSACREPQKVE
jgi:hypothetical protein